MKKFFFFLVLVPSLLIAQLQMFEQPLSPRIANYTIDCKLDVEKKLITAVEILEWKNTSDDYIGEMQFHLYQNAFRDEKSTKYIERGGFPKELRSDESKRGYCEIKKITLPDGTDLTDNYRFIHPDDDNEYDKTVISLALPEKIPPGKSIELEIEFETKLPFAVERSGYEGDYFFAGQWFPKVGVYEEGKWNCHQFHATGEFYADFGVYDVKITLPENYTVGATGVKVDEKNIGDGLKQHQFYCEDVHDFAWVADVDYVVYEDKHKGIGITLLCQEKNTSFADNYLKSVKIAIDYYGKYGKYPWPKITVVDPEGINTTGGMEYPTLFTGGALKGVPESVMITEMVTIHEFGHNYWHGMVASNEFEEAWLDEGLNSYSTTKALEYGYPNRSMFDILGFKASAREFERVGYIANYSKGIILQNSWEYNAGGYSVNSYQKADLMLLTLEKYFGEKVWMKVMKTYFQRWKFKHPHSQDFLNVVTEVTGKDMSGFFDQYLKTNHYVDYLIHSTRRKKGWLCQDKDKWYNRVVIRKDGHLVFPVQIEFKFEDGTKEVKEWDGNNGANGKVFVFKDYPKMTSVVIDPDNILEFEIYKINNSWTEEGHKSGAKKWGVKFMFLVQNILHLFTIFA